MHAVKHRLWPSIACGHLQYSLKANCTLETGRLLRPLSALHAPVHAPLLT